MKIRGTTITTPIARHAVADDSAISRKPWSSKNTVDKLCPSFTESGSIVCCEPVEDYPLEVTVQINCVQEEGGDPCSMGVGKNLYNVAKYPLTSGFYINHKKGSCSASTSYACTTSKVEDGQANPAYIPIAGLAGKTITLNHTPGGANPGMAFYDVGRNYISGAKGEAVVVPDNAAYMAFSVPIAYADGSDVQIEIGEVSTEYEPYESDRGIRGHDRGQIIHAGKNLFSGILGMPVPIYIPANTWFTVSANSTPPSCRIYFEDGTTDSISWSTGNQSINGKTRYFRYLKYEQPVHFIQRSDAEGEFQVELGKKATVYEPYRARVVTWPFGRTVYGGIFDLHTGKLLITHNCIESYNGEDVPDGWISSTGELSTGSQVVFPLQETKTVWVDPVEVTAVQGINTLYDCTGNALGSMLNISGRLDPVYTIEKLTKAIIALGGNI